MPEKKLYAKIAAVTKELDRIPKRGYNDFHKYHYALEADVKAKLQELLPKHGLAQFVSMEAVEHDGQYCRVTLRITLYCTDTGESVTGLWQGVGMDKGDKAIYKAYTGAIKYWLMTNFLIPTGDDPEGDTETDKIVAKEAQAKEEGKLRAQEQLRNAPQKPQNAPQSPPEGQADISAIKKEVAELWAKYATLAGFDPGDTEKKREYTQSVLQKAKPATKVDFAKMKTAIEIDIAQRVSR